VVAGIGLPLILAGCGLGAEGSYNEVSQRDAEGLKTAQTWVLRWIYYDKAPPLVRAELERRGAVRPEYWPLIDEHKIAIGMNTDELQTAWGNGLEQHQTVTASGSHIQWVHYNGSPTDATYVYTDNGIITTIQN
jgi:hypothetical protein